MTIASRHRGGHRHAASGNALIEFSLFLPWLIFLFTAIFDFGFYAYAFIGVENAARAGVLQTAVNSATATNQSGACRIALDSLRGLPNIGSSFTSGCSSDPVTVTASYCDASTLCPGGAASADGGPASVVAVTYRMPALFRFPLRPAVTISRTAQMRLGDTSQ
jgi:Flp pilus assembly protein TadG